ncbi:MAG: acyl dehydratase [Salinarimonadaceae bacterium]|nr:MAG: acyl dehydratase [Salinarimonadaceae bacterium]
MTLKNSFTPPKIGDAVTFRKTMTVAEQAMFTGISGNLGGLYVDRVKAREAGLADMAVFELAAASLLSTCLSRLAGPGHRIERWSIAFERAVPVGASVEASATLTSSEAGRLVFALSLRSDGTSLSTGEAVLVPVSPA